MREEAMSNFPVLKITAPSVDGHTANITLDGVPLTSVLAITLHVNAARPTTATIVMDVDADVEMPVVHASATTH